MMTKHSRDHAGLRT